MVMIGQNNQGYGGGGGGGVIVGLAAVGLTGWSIVHLFSLSAVLAVAVAAYVIVGIVFYAVTEQKWPRNSGLIKFLLGLSIVIAALINPLAFVTGGVSFAMLDGAIFVLLSIALLIGLWAELSIALKALAIATLVVLAGAPFSEPVKRNEKWYVVAEVRDQHCSPIESALATCDAVSRATGEVVASGGEQYTDLSGTAGFRFQGNPVGKVARCSAGTSDYPSRTVIAEPRLLGLTRAVIVLDDPQSPTPAPESCPSN
jgi:hypothetical protein